MQLTLEKPDYDYSLRAADGSRALVNDRTLTRSFVLAPDHLGEDWPVRDARAMTPANLAPVLALEPELILLGSGEGMVFPPAAVMGTGLSRGIGIEVMTNAAAARTFNVLAGEGRKVAAAFILSGTLAGAD